jgi:hypothetical protein
LENRYSPKGDELQGMNREALAWAQRFFIKIAPPGWRFGCRLV